MRGNQQIPEGGFTFAHLTDPHLTDPLGASWRQLANKRLLGYLSWRRKRSAEHRVEVLEALLADLALTRPQHIVVTGDLTQIGLPDEFRQARRWLERLGEREQVTVVPGNHDAYVRADWAQTGACWEDYMRSDPGYRGSAALFPSLRVRDGVAVIGLNSAVVTPPFMATGRLGRAQRERFAGLLRRTGEQGLFRLVLLHHPPRVKDEKWRKRLVDGDALCRILGDEGAARARSPQRRRGHPLRRRRYPGVRHSVRVRARPATGALCPVLPVPGAARRAELVGADPHPRLSAGDGHLHRAGRALPVVAGNGLDQLLIGDGIDVDGGLRVGQMDRGDGDVQALRKLGQRFIQC
jgi:hypothetical protein